MVAPGWLGFQQSGVGMSCFKHFAGWVCWKMAGIAVDLSGFGRFNAKLVAGG